MRLTHIGGPTVLIETEGWRILTDPTFDPPGRRYGFGWGTSSTKTAGPALQPHEVGPIDVVLLSHDHHADNLDALGREALTAAGTVVTTRPGARRLGHPHVRGLEPGEATTITRPGRPDLTLIATPCRHGPPLSRPVAGTVIGFALGVGSSTTTRLWMTGDTVLHDAVRRTATGLDVDVLLVHLGCVRFPITGPLRYSMSSRDALELIALSNPRVAVPVHYEGWSHFSQPEDVARRTLTGVTTTQVHWLDRGVAAEVPPREQAR
ncbi:MBL fold metallo-hydrolase [Nocardioides sp. GXQ0305]|uniref:MBL fold metallo-hydrolase n=1 Tax=Nocardioides sp. GXQ0305 TaxID=3423912 RepID=UPI003D7DD7F3